MHFIAPGKSTDSIIDFRDREKTKINNSIQYNVTPTKIVEAFGKRCCGSLSLSNKISSSSNFYSYSFFFSQLVFSFVFRFFLLFVFIFVCVCVQFLYPFLIPYFISCSSNYFISLSSNLEKCSWTTTLKRKTFCFRVNFVLFCFV